jgi:hypothetical protein
MVYVSAPQTRELTMASGKPPPGALHELIGSGGTKIWGHVSSCRGGRGQRGWVVGLCCLMLVVFVFVFCVVVTSSLLEPPTLPT